MEIVLRIVALVAGAALIFYFFKSVIRIGILNERYVDSLAFWVSRWVWQLFQLRVGLRKRSELEVHEIMSWYWPSTMMAVISTWFVMVTAGFALLNWAVGANATLVEAFISSGSALSTLGFSTPPQRSGQFLAIFEGAIGLFLVVYLFTFLPGLLDIIRDRGNRISWLYHRAGEKPTGAALLASFYKSGRPDRLDDAAEDWEGFFRNLSHAKTFQPILSVVRPLNPEQSWVCAFGVFLDALALARTATKHGGNATRICLEVGVAALKAIHSSMRGTPLEPREQPGLMNVTRGNFDAACDELRKAGLPMREDMDAAWVDFVESRKLYEQEVAWLAATLSGDQPYWPSLKRGQQ